ncbi:ankyrin [Ascodesmis nigricans]|uniref:Ankyrin n=1 Tax=Ascodesmis nigricans TaxID=341454 RepID=A0A4S2MVQ5_9PEZI|nr:ankyrin [Ascodesmis nigricans]
MHIRALQNAKNPLLRAISVGDLLTVMACISDSTGLDAYILCEFDCPNTNKRRRTLRTALQIASSYGERLEVVKTLLEAGADVNAAAARDSGRTALQAAAEGGHLDVLRELMDAPIPPRDFEAAIISASTSGIVSVVKRLTALARLNHSYPIGITSKGWNQALHSACMNGHVQVVNLLLHWGKAMIDSNNQDGRTPLHVALAYKQYQVVEYLLQNGANSAIRDAEHKTPVQVLLGSGDIKRLRWLIEEGVSMVGIEASAIRDLMKCSEECCLRFVLDQAGKQDLQKAIRPGMDFSTPENRKRKHIKEGVTRAIVTTYGTKTPSKFVEAFCDSALLQQPPIHIRWMYSHRTGHIFDLPNLETTAIEVTETTYDDDLLCYMWLPYFSSTSSQATEIDGNVKRFQFHKEKNSIVWVMKRVLQPINDDDRMTTKDVYIWRSVEFRSTTNRCWIPDHGVEFFTWFVMDMEQTWVKLLECSKLHLSVRRKQILKQKGESSDTIDFILEDSQSWSKFRDVLEEQMSVYRKMISAFQDKSILYQEAMDPHQLSIGLGGSDLQAIKDLRATVGKLESLCEKELEILEKATKEMIELEFNLVSSIFEARKSLSASFSMKRLSWITFIFLPLMFTSSLFGMNVDLLSKNTSWRWYLALSVPTLLLVLLTWLLFKYVPIEKWVEKKAGKRVQSIVEKTSKRLKKRPNSDEEAP